MGECATEGLHAKSCIFLSYTEIVPRKDPIESCLGFDWDEGNSSKNWERHQVIPDEAEQVFFNCPLIVRSDVAHSKAERRYYALGQTDAERWLFVAFTIRRNLIRVISARDMNRREREAYGRHEETNS
jgi:uncharacterized DUF497 family protein